MAKVEEVVNEVLDPIFMPKDPIFMQEFDLPLEENGAKQNGTNSNNYHRHHKELSKVITKIKGEVKENAEAINFLMSFIPKEDFRNAIKRYNAFKQQQYKLQKEAEKTDQMRDRLYKLSIVK